MRLICSFKTNFSKSQLVAKKEQRNRIDTKLVMIKYSCFLHGEEFKLN